VDLFAEGFIVPSRELHLHHNIIAQEHTMAIPGNVRDERPTVTVALVSLVFASAAIGVVTASALSPILVGLAGVMKGLDLYTLTLLGVIFLCASASGTIGFAFSAIAGAIIFYIEPNPIKAVQIMIMASIGLQTYSVLALFRQISWRRCLPFVAGGALTIPVGLAILFAAQPDSYIGAFGAALIAYSAYMLLRRPVTIARRGALGDFLVGSLGGLTGPLAAFPGAFVTIWCALQGLDKVESRAIYQPYILIMQLLTLAAMYWAGGPNPVDLGLTLYMLPGIAGAWVGLRIFKQLTDTQFQRLVTIGLMVSGLVMVLK
jgi:uncharacterized membrane protein YfcA